MRGLRSVWKTNSMARVESAFETNPIEQKGPVDARKRGGADAVKSLARH